MQNIPTMQSNLDIKQHFAAVNIVTRRQNSHFLESIMTPSVIKMSKKKFFKVQPATTRFQGQEFIKRILNFYK